MDINAYLEKHRKVFNLGGYEMLGVRPPIKCADGLWLSVQASHSHYCRPRDDIGPYEAVEVATHKSLPELSEYEENDAAIYGWVPVELVEQVIENHGGTAEKATINPVTLCVGTYRILRSGAVQDNLTPVEFKGQALAKVKNYLGNSDSRWVSETLYEVADGRLVVYTQYRSNWQDETESMELVAVTREDLGVGGRFERLGREAGLIDPLTLDQALGMGE